MESDFYVGESGVLKAMDGDPTVLEIHPLNGRVAYGWVFPKKEHLTIGVAGSGNHMHPLRTIFENFRKRMESYLDVKLVPEKRRTYFLGGDGLGNRNVTTRAVLIGDAAGFVDPMMGEGIAYAMQSGQYAAQVIAKCIQNSHTEEKNLLEYQRLCNDKFAANFAMAEWAALRGTDFAERILSIAQTLDFSSDILAGLARGELGYSDIPPLVLRKLPRKIPRLIQQVIRRRMQNNH
jgi:flavin-dependent dehydrogenase